MEKAESFIFTSRIDYSKLKVAELKKLASDVGIKGYSKMLKKELINVLNKNNEKKEVNDGLGEVDYKQEKMDITKVADIKMNKLNEIEENTKLIKINKGNGAGGANTNYYGKKFEEKTNNQQRLLEMGYTEKSFTKNPKKASDYYLSKIFEDKSHMLFLQNGLKIYMKDKYNIELFRCPDEAYIIEYTTGRKVIKILEKKEQNVDGSVETKLWAGPSLKREYELVLGVEFEVFYGFCVNEFLKNKLISNEKKI